MSSLWSRMRLPLLATLAAVSLSACVVVPPHRHYSAGVAVEAPGPGWLWVDGYWRSSGRGRVWIEGHWARR